MSSPDTPEPLPEESPPAPPPSLRSRALRASFWTILERVASYVLRLGFNLVMTRLLFPEAFGIMALVHAVIQGLQLFSDVGVRVSVVQHARGEDPPFLGTAWTVQMIRGAVLALLACALAWPMAEAYQEAELLVLIPFVGLNPLIASFASPKVLVLDRQLHRGHITVLSLCATLLGMAVMGIWAWVAPSVWALAVGGIVSAVVSVIGAHVFLPGQAPRPQWEASARRELFRFGRWILVSTALVFVAMNADRFFLAKVIPMGLFGVYSIGRMFARLPIELVGAMTGRITLPAYSRLLERGESLQRPFTEARRYVLAPGCAVLSGLVLLGPAMIALLYEDEYSAAGWMIQLLALGAWFEILAATNGDALLAMGQSGWTAAGNLVKIVFLALGLFGGYAAFGFPGALIGMSFSEIPKYLFIATRTRVSGLKGWPIEACLSSIMVASCGMAWAFGTEGPVDVSPTIQVVGATLFFLAVWIPVAFWLYRSWKGRK